HDFNALLQFPAHEISSGRVRGKIYVAEGMGAYFMWRPAGEDALNQVRGVPVRILLNVRARIVAIPISLPTSVLRRPGHVGVSQSATSSFATLEKKMANGRPRDRDGVLFQNANEIRNILAATQRAKVSLLQAAAAESPGNLKVSRDRCRSP